MKNIKRRYFDISTGGAAIQSLRQNKDLMNKDVLDAMNRTTISQEDWDRPPTRETILIILIGIVAQCIQRNESALITIQKDSWNDLMASGTGTDKIRSGFRQLLSLDPDLVSLEFIPSGHS